MIGLSVKVDTRQALRVMAQVKKQIAFANVQALNSVAFNIQKAERAAIGTVFAHPRPFTVNSVFTAKATKASPTATIFVKPKTAIYLKPFEDGGSHYLPTRPELGRVLLEPVHMPVDAYEQIRKAALNALLARPDVFVGTIHGILGIWQRGKRGTRRDGGYGTKGKLNTVDGRQTTLVLMAKVIPNQPVRKHLEFVKRGEGLFLQQYPAAFEAAFARAMATMKGST